jgi:phosphatidylglycerophosphatase A
MVGLALAICLATVVGFYATSRYQQQTGKHDPKEVVIDELVGIWITLLAVPTWVYFVPAFLLFRLFDITKPWPIGWADKKVPGALGVMLDDILAGALAAACLYGMVHIFGAMPF